MSYSEISASYPKARKEYACEWCGQKIEIGLKHLSRFYRFDGDLNSGRMHLECEKEMQKDHDSSDGWVWGSNERPK